jgi:hypothetical protein
MSFRTRVTSLALLATVIPTVALAQGSFADKIRQGVNSAGGPSGFQPGGPELPQIIGNVIAVLLSFVGVVLLVIMLYAGFQWMTAGGDSKKVIEARGRIMNALIGLIILAASYAIVDFVITRLTFAGGGNTGIQSSGQQ